MITVELTNEEALMFRKFQEYHEPIGYFLGYMESLKLVDLRNMSIQMDIDNNGVIAHTSITRHYRK